MSSLKLTLTTSDRMDDNIKPVSPQIYTAATPANYSATLGDLNYSPTPAVLPSYCNTCLDCSALFGNTSLGAMFGWDFARSREFWNNDIALTDEQREQTLLQKRIKIIGIDIMPLALEYSKNMNIVDEYIVQNFQNEMLPETRRALLEADVMILQQCMLHMPLEHLAQWLEAFLEDRTRPKRMVYDCSPVYDTRDISPNALLRDIPGVKFTEKYYPYRKKNEAEFRVIEQKDKLMYEYQYVVDFLPQIVQMHARE